MNHQKSRALKCNLKPTKQFINYLLVISFVILSALISHGQSRQMTHDTLRMRPNTVRVIGVLKKIDSQSAKLRIIKIVAQGPGIINALSVGDEIVINLSNASKKLVGFKVEGYLKEELEIDASQSRYKLIDTSLSKLK